MNFTSLWRCISQSDSVKLSSVAGELPKQWIIQLFQIRSSTDALSVPASAAPLTGLKALLLFFTSTARPSFMLLSGYGAENCHCGSVGGGLVLASQQANVNLPDKVLQRWALLSGTGSSLHLKGNSFSFFSQSLFNPTYGRSEAHFQRPGVTKITRTDKDEAWIPLPFTWYTHSTPISLFAFFNSMQPCWRISGPFNNLLVNFVGKAVYLFLSCWFFITTWTLPLRGNAKGWLTIVIFSYYLSKYCCILIEFIHYLLCRYFKTAKETPLAGKNEIILTKVRVHWCQIALPTAQPGVHCYVEIT